MELISPKERTALVFGASGEVLHLELRDHYAADAVPFAAWRETGVLDLGLTRRWCEIVTAGIAAGGTFRRVCVVSEPLSDYQRWAYAISGPQVDAGEDIRWVPRGLASTVTLPGNDFWLLDDAAIFNVFDSADVCVQVQLYREADVLRFCRDVFETVWGVGIPHREFVPR